ncbi:hypothetical protein QUA44_10100 [Microcoleus sp. N9_A2]
MGNRELRIGYWKLEQQLSTASCQLSTASCQLSTVNCQLSTVN